MSKLKSAQLQRQGAIVSVVLYPPKPIIQQLQAQGNSNPKASFSALIDTGAESTSISQKEIDSIGLISRDFKAMIGTTGDERWSPVYDVTLDIGFSNAESIKIELEVATIDLDRIGVYALIGRDILSFCKLNYHGPEGAFQLDFIGAT